MSMAVLEKLPARDVAEAALMVAADPVLSAQVAGLRYVGDATPGIRRRRHGKGFTYVDPRGRTIRDVRERRRIAALAIPPAWTQVWICPLANGHLQATGRDARGRKQYRYHPDWRAVRDETKFGRMIAFGEALPRIRDEVERDLARPGLAREKVLATVVKLLETTLLRIGNEEYARDNNSFGLTTLRNHHATVDGASVELRFRGKAGKERAVKIRDRRLAQVVRRCRELPGQELFQYVDEEGKLASVGSEDVNAYLREAGGEDFSAKDFRTWGGTILALSELAAMDGSGSRTEANRAIVEAVKKVAAQLGNRPAICRKYYIHPAVVEAFTAGLLTPPAGPAGSPITGAIGAAPRDAAWLRRLEQHALAVLRGEAG